MRTPQNSPKKSPRKPGAKTPSKYGTSGQSSLQFKAASTSQPRLKTPPPVVQPMSPPETPQKPKFDPNGHVYLQEYDRILETQHISEPHFAPGISAAEKILLHFDMSYEYGPTVGMTRMARWNRAKRYDLDPPPIVYKILSSTSDTAFTEPYSYGRGSLL